MHGYVAYCMKHGHDWQPTTYKGHYKCAICGAKMTRFCADGYFCKGCEE